MPVVIENDVIKSMGVTEEVPIEAAAEEEVVVEEEVCSGLMLFSAISRKPRSAMASICSAVASPGGMPVFLSDRVTAR